MTANYVSAARVKRRNKGRRSKVRSSIWGFATADISEVTRCSWEMFLFDVESVSILISLRRSVATVTFRDRHSYLARVFDDTSVLNRSLDTIQTSKIQYRTR